MRTLKRFFIEVPFTIWSNVFYLVPFVTAVYWQLWPTAMLCVAVAVFSTLYHLSDEKRFLHPDSISAWLLVLVNLALCYMGHLDHPSFAIGLVVLGFALYWSLARPGSVKYQIHHGLWHAATSLVTLFCIFTFAL